jgi:hypothetical protein
MYGLVTVIHTERIALVDEFREIIDDRLEKMNVEAIAFRR